MEMKFLQEKSGEAARLLDAMASANRLLILCNLLDRELSVNALAEAVDMSQSALSQQLSKLRALGLVSTRRDGHTIYYRLSSEEVEKLLATLYEVYCAT